MNQIHNLPKMMYPAGGFLGGRSRETVYLVRVFRHHLGFAKCGELVKEGEEGCGSGIFCPLPLLPHSPLFLTPTPFSILLHSPKPLQCFPNPR